MRQGGEAHWLVVSQKIVWKKKSLLGRGEGERKVVLREHVRAGGEGGVVFW